MLRLLEAQQQEPAEASGLVDPAEHRLDGYLAQPVSAAPFSLRKRRVMAVLRLSGGAGRSANLNRRITP